MSSAICVPYTFEPGFSSNHTTIPDGGIRLAIGASRRRVLGMVLSGGLLLAIAGLAVGLAVAALVLPSLSGLLYGVEPFDPTTFLVTPAVLLVVATVAAIIPAWRAARVDPIRAIRES